MDARTAADDAWSRDDPSQQRPNGRDRDPPGLASINPATLQNLPIPPRQWLVPEWIPLGRATSLYGAGGEGKTLLAQMLATACAIAHKKWVGLPVQQCNSLLFFCEDDIDEMHRRQQDINDLFGCTFADLSAMRWLPRLGEDNALMTFDNGRCRHTSLFDQLLTAAKEHDAKLTITDTLADVFSGNENDRAQARQFAQTALGFLARETNGAAVVLAHPSVAGAQSDGGSGSTGWKGAFRSQLYLTTPKTEEGEPPDPDLRVLTRVKANFARRGETVEIRWRNGVFIPLHASTGVTASIERRAAENVFLDLLDKVTADGRFVSDSNRAPNFAPRLFALRPDRERFTKKDFERAMQVLFATKKIALGKCKSASRHDRECIHRVVEI